MCHQEISLQEGECGSPGQYRLVEGVDRRHGYYLGQIKNRCQWSKGYKHYLTV